MPLTLNQRIKKDLTDLYNGGNTPGEIQEALNLNRQLSGQSGMISFATKALPGYYAGKRDAKTFMIMINPGVDVSLANSNLKCDICKRSMKNASDDTNYHLSSENYGNRDKYRYDSFDVKQAFFLHKWSNTGIQLPRNLCANPLSKRQILLNAKENVLTEKMQMDLLPYASASFNGLNKAQLSLLIPFLETVFEEILSHDRTYVIFCSNIFKDLFDEYNKSHPNTIQTVNKLTKKIGNSKIQGKCTKVTIKYNNKLITAIIAHTFASRALSTAYKLMEDYGDICYNTYINKP